MLFDCIDAWFGRRCLAATTEQTNAVRHRFEKPIHNVKDANGQMPRYRCEQRICFLFISGYVRSAFRQTCRRGASGGAYRDRTDDLMLAKQPLSQLS